MVSSLISLFFLYICIKSVFSSILLFEYLRWLKCTVILCSLTPVRPPKNRAPQIIIEMTSSPLSLFYSPSSPLLYLPSELSVWMKNSLSEKRIASPCQPIHKLIKNAFDLSRCERDEHFLFMWYKIKFFAAFFISSNSRKSF